MEKILRNYSVNKVTNVKIPVFLADPDVVASNTVATPPTVDPFNPTTDAGNPGVQPQDAQAADGNDPVMRAAILAPTNDTNIFNPGAQTQVGQETTSQTDNNPAPDVNQGGEAPLMSAASVPAAGQDATTSQGSNPPPDTNPGGGGEPPLLLATNLTANEGTPPVTPDSGNPSDPLQSIQQAGQDLNAASGQAAQNVNDSVTQANGDIQQAPPPEPSAATNTEFVQPSGDNAPPPASEPDPAINGAAEVGRAVLSAVPVVGPAVSAGEAIAGQTITGRELSTEERLALGASAALGAIPVAQGAKAALAVGESGLLAAAGTAAEKVLSSPALGAQVSGAVNELLTL